jgi:parallel beta-helix repeat protein
MPRLKCVIVAVAAGVLLALSAFPAVALASSPLPNGFTAKVIANSGDVITGTIDATGYDIGIYVGPGVHNVLVNGVTVSGANDEGILVQRASNILIKNSTIEGNGVAPYAGLTEVKAIVLAGAENCLVTRNTIKDNLKGGVSIVDDGVNSTFAPTPIGSAVAAVQDVVSTNLIENNWGDCAIVISAKNVGGGVSYNMVLGNEVSGGVGGIVIAGGAFGPVQLHANTILKNVVAGGFLPGINIHAFGPGVITDTVVSHNVLSDNGTGEVAPGTKGIEIFAVPGVGTISGTQVIADSVSNDYFGVWHVGDANTKIINLTTSSVTVPIAP